jgi:hypothetical protein
MSFDKLNKDYKCGHEMPSHENSAYMSLKKGLETSVKHELELLEDNRAIYNNNKVNKIKKGRKMDNGL